MPRLTQARLNVAKPADRAYKLFDSDGLFLLIKPSGASGWRFRYRWNGHERQLSVGPYPTVPLTKARERRDTLRRQIVDGTDPSADRKKQRAAQVAASSDRFEVISDEFWSEHSKSLAKTTRTAEGTRREYLNEAFSEKPLASITPVDVANAIRDIKSAHGYDTARRCHGLADRIWQRAVVLGKAPSNPAATFKPTVVIGRPPQTRHRPGITDPNKLAALLRSIDGYTGSATVRAALRIQARVFLRSGKELAKARWSEIDFERAIWTIPAARMKQRYVRNSDHLVPLSTQVIAELRELARLTKRGPDAFIFAGLSPKKTISENTLNAALRGMGYDTKTVHCAHGFRTTAKTMLLERLRFNDRWIEAQSARAKIGTGASYDKSEFLEDRTVMMQRWSDYLAELLA